METIIDNIIPHLAPFWPMLTILAYVLGGFLIFLACVQTVNAVGKSGPQKSSILVVLTFFSGILLLNFPAWMDALATTLFNSGSEQSLSYTAPGHPGASYVTFAVRFVQIIGAIGIIRGCMLLRDSANQSPQFYRAVTHFIGGIICVNIVQFLNMIGSTAGGDMQSTISAIIG